MSAGACDEKEIDQVQGQSAAQEGGIFVASYVVAVVATTVPYAMVLVCCEGSPTGCADTTYTGVRANPCEPIDGRFVLAIAFPTCPCRIRPCRPPTLLKARAAPCTGHTRLPRRSRSREADARRQNNQFLPRWYSWTNLERELWPTPKSSIPRE
jgi:hypothetical protein